MGPVNGGVVDGATRHDALLVVVAFALVYVVWGSTYLAIAWAVETIPPFTMIAARCLIAGAVLYGWARLRGAPRPSAADWGHALVAGTLLFGTGQAVLAWAETRIASGPAALLIATEPLFVVLLGWRGGRLVGATRRGPRPSVRALTALAVGFGGVAVMVLPGGGTRLDVAGAVATLLASLSWSVGVFRARARPGVPATQLAGMQLLAGGAVLTVFASASGGAAVVLSHPPSPRSLLAFAYLVVLGSVVTYGAYVWLLDRVGPARLSTHGYVNPVVAVALGALLGGEPVSVPLIVATVSILGAVAVLVQPERPMAVGRRRARTGAEGASDSPAASATSPAAIRGPGLSSTGRFRWRVRTRGSPAPCSDHG